MPKTPPLVAVSWAAPRIGKRCPLRENARSAWDSKPGARPIRSSHSARDRKFAREAADRGIRVMIAAAGGAAHLAGVIRPILAAGAGGCRSSRRPFTVWTRSFRSRKCREAFPLAHWPLACGPRRTRRSWLRPFSALSDKKIRQDLQAFAKADEAGSPRKLPK